MKCIFFTTAGITGGGGGGGGGEEPGRSGRSLDLFSSQKSNY